MNNWLGFACKEEIPKISPAENPPEMRFESKLNKPKVIPSKFKQYSLNMQDETTKKNQGKGMEEQIADIPIDKKNFFESNNTNKM